jgi:hypothetical protein
MIIGAVPVIHVVVDGGPSIADWITAGTGAAALLVAIVAVWPTWRQLRMLVADRERQQAASFAMWAQYSAAAKEMQILYANSGTLPVYDVQGKITIGDGRRPTNFERGTIGPAPEPVPDLAISAMMNGEIMACLRERFGDRIDRTNAYGDPNPPGDVLLARPISARAFVSRSSSGMPLASPGTACPMAD